MLVTAATAALSFSLVTGLLQNTAAPASSSAASGTSVTSVCTGSVDAVETGYTENAPSVATGPVAEDASYTLSSRQLSGLASTRGPAIANCESKLRQAQPAAFKKWGYLSARAVEIAVDVTITFLASTLICSFTGPVGCAWGVRFASFAGGFAGALAFQYLTEGVINWSSVGAAFFDATISMLAFSGLDKLEEAYVGKGVKAAFTASGKAIASVAKRIGSAGAGMSSSITSALGNIVTHTSTWAFPFPAAAAVAVVPAIAESSGNAVADGVQLRVPSASAGSTDTINDLFSGSAGKRFYNWDIEETSNTNSDGAIGYLIGQGSNCLKDNSGTVSLSACNVHDDTQIWYVDGDELMSVHGQCLDELGSSSSRITISCDGLTYVTNPNKQDDQFLITPPGGTYIPDTVAQWKSHVSSYEHA
ncbi:MULTISPECIES: hypothetical protein [unclassified Streptomyces]|uniref:hypothetical protein n=1 Tax=unclassified Streptomyces TaxID=2593676 RepID=UPI00190DCB65|nr:MULTISPECIES: hypothetical protein [unclassified Streptomyces]